MAIEQKQVEYAKEVDDVLVLLVELVKDVKAKKDLGAIAAENLPNLMAAITGADQVGAEVQANKAVVLQTVGHRLGDLASVFVS